MMQPRRAVGIGHNNDITFRCWQSGDLRSFHVSGGGRTRGRVSRLSDLSQQDDGRVASRLVRLRSANLPLRLAAAVGSTDAIRIRCAA